MNFDEIRASNIARNQQFLGELFDIPIEIPIVDNNISNIDIYFDADTRSKFYAVISLYSNRQKEISIIWNYLHQVIIFIIL